MDKLDLHTPDFTAENIAKLAELFPNCVTETRDEETGAVRRAVDFDLLQQELSDDLVEGTAERYRLDWPGKKQALATANTPINKTLRPSREESVDFDTTQNLYIEGDNLDALKLLQETYLGQVKMIYIDPPYNTGKDFVYKDNFRRSADEELLESGQTDDEGNRLVANTESNGRFHSDWLSMMYPRLKLARNLLKEDGVIFISIDDNEVHNIRKMCDEVFGEENFMGVASRRTGTPSGQGYGILVNEIDYVVVYARSSSASFEGLPFTNKDAEIYNLSDEFGRYLIRPLRKTGGEDLREDRPSMYYPIVAPDGTDVFPLGPGGYESRWRCGKKSYVQLITDNRIEWKKRKTDGKSDWAPHQKFYLEGRTKQPSDLWDNIDGNKKGTIEVKQLLNTKAFDSPKPVALVDRCLRISSEPDDLILDFFSGSATTAHAVMQLNAEDGGNRRHIMVQLPEVCDEKSAAAKAGYSTIAEIGKERIRRAAAKIREELEAQLEGELPETDKHKEITTKLAQLDTGFRVLKIDSSTYADVHKRPDEVTQAALDIDVENLKSDRSAEDLLFQVLLDWGVDLSLPITNETIGDKLVFTVGAPAEGQDDAQAAIIACFEPKLSEELITAIAKKQPVGAVFRDSSFTDDAAKINAEQLFKHHSPSTELKTI